MSSHYTIEFEVHVRMDIDPQSVALLDYLLNGIGERPPQWPAHAYFKQDEKWLKPMNRVEGFNTNRSGACLEETGNDGRGRTLRVAHLRQTSHKLESVFEDSLRLMQWLSTLSSSNGFAGYIKCDETDDVMFLLYVYDRELYAAKPPTGDVHHFGTGAIRQISEN